MKKATIGFALALNLAAVGACADSSHMPSESFERPLLLQTKVQPTEPFRAFRLGKFSLCRSSAVQFAPDNAYLIFSQPTYWPGAFADSSSSIGILGLACFRRLRDLAQCGASYFNPVGLHVEAEDSRSRSFFVIVGGDELLRLDLSNPAAPVLLDDSALPSAIGKLQAGTTTTTSSKATEEAARVIREARLLNWESQGYTVRAITNVSGASAAILENSKTLRLALADQTRVLLRSNLYSPFAHQVAVSLSNGHPVLTATGYSQVSGALAAASHEEPIVDTSGGTIIGYWSDLGFFRDASGRSVPARPGLQPERGFQILDAASAPGWRSTAAIFQSPTGKEQIKIALGDEVVRFDCDPAGAETPVSFTRERLGPSDWTVVASIATPLNARGTVVMFPGGPGDGVGQFYDNSSARHFLAAGYRVVAIDYSGSGLENSATQERLRENPLMALAKDVRVLQGQWSQIVPTGEAIIEGESFGSIPAAMLAQQRPGTPLVLIAPYLRHRDPASWIPSPVKAAYQRRFETTALALGSRAQIIAFQLRLDSLYSRLHPGKTLVVSGALDKISPPADQYIVAGGHADHVNITASHALITSSEATWSAVADWLSKTRPQTLSNGR